MKVLVSGSTGLVGEALLARLRAARHETERLVRGHTDQEGVGWDPEHGFIDRPALNGYDAVVHLAGENIAKRRWTRRQMERIRTSRVDATRLLAEALASIERKPAVLVCASAIGFYGDRGQTVLDEASGPGDGFLAEVCQAWESAADPARQAGIRVVNLRFGVVLSRHGGALASMLLPFKLGLGGPIGGGQQIMSWIALADAVRAIEFVMTNGSLAGPVNAVAPAPVTNREYTKMLGAVLGRPTVFPMPAFAARLAFGRLANELLLASTCVLPKRLVENGFEFEYDQLEPALRYALDKTA